MRRLFLAATAMSTAAMAGIDYPPTPDLSAYVKTVNAAAPNPSTGAVTISIPTQYTDAQAVTAAQTGITNFVSPNLIMPNGANLAHTIYGWAASAGVTITPTADTTIFGTGGAGSLTVPVAGFFQNAQFDILADGIGTTGLANVATMTFKVKIGSTVVATATTGAWPVSISQIPVSFHATCTVLTAGASGMVFCTGSIMIGSGLGSFSPSGTFVFTGSPTTINLASGGTFDVTASLSSAIGSPTAKFYTARITQTN